MAASQNLNPWWLSTIPAAVKILGLDGPIVRQLKFCRRLLNFLLSVDVLAQVVAKARRVKVFLGDECPPLVKIEARSGWEIRNPYAAKDFEGERLEVKRPKIFANAAVPPLHHFDKRH